MLIKKLTLNNFKSFGKFADLYFDKGINCIIGPNGSGKTNILDAIIFVLGKISAKQLRAEKSSNLIYNGAKTKKSAEKAEVSIYFNNENRIFPLDDKEIKITRIVFQDGSSKYKICEKTKTRYEVLELLRSAGIDPDGYNIVTQGDVARIVEATPLERRELIEEIAGIAEFEERKNEALNKLEKVKIKLEETNLILRERQAFLKQLKQDRDQALAWRALNDRIRSLNASIAKANVDIKNAEIEKANKKKFEIEEKIKEIDLSLSEAEKKLTEEKEKLEKINKEIEEKSEKKLKALHLEQSKKQKTYSEIKIDLASIESSIFEINASLARSQKNKRDSEIKLNAISQELKLNQELLKDLSDKLEKLNQEIEKFKVANKLEDAVKVEKEIFNLDLQIENLTSTINKLQERKQETLRSLDKLEFEIQTARKRVEDVEEALKKEQEKISKIIDAKKKFKEVVEAINSLLKEDSLIFEKIKNLQERKAEIKFELEATRSVSNEIVAVLSKKFAKAIVSQLFASDERYAKAIETALGAFKDALIVKSYDAALRALNFLKKQKLGRASFVIEESRAKKIESNSILNKIEFDKEKEKIFSNLLGDVVLAENDEQAIELAKQGKRAVSLEGNLFGEGKAIGGFVKPALLKVHNIKKQLNQIEEEIKNLERAKAANSKKLDELKTEKIELENLITRGEALGLDIDLESAKLYAQELEKNKANLNESLLAIESEIEKQQVEISNLKSLKAKLKNELLKLRDPATISKLNELEANRKNLSNKINETNKKIAALEAQEKEIEIQIKNLDSEIANLDSNLKEKLNAKESSEGKLSILKEEIEKISKEIERLSLENAELFALKKEISNNLSSTENQILENKKSKNALECELNNIKFELVKGQSELGDWQNKLNSYGQIEIVKKPLEELKKELSECEEKISKLGAINLKALELYDRIFEQYSEMLEKKKIIVKEKKEILNLLEAIEKNKKEKFFETLNLINEAFTKTFSKLTKKGNGYLELTNQAKPFEAGLLIKVQISNDKFLDLRSLSGGEKTLTALAFLFAIQEIKNSRFYIFDEVDAALDKENSALLSELLKRYSERAQYIVVTHNDILTQVADIVLGVAFNPHIESSVVVSLKVNENK